jgi:hypothetical protein
MFQCVGEFVLHIEFRAEDWGDGHGEINFQKEKSKLS